MGTPSSHPHVAPDSVIQQPSAIETTWVETRSVELPTPPPSAIAAFALDAPRPGEWAPGAGLEINGWVIGHEVPVVGVYASGDTSSERVFPLDVRRPDVAGDYPALSGAENSGFSFWAPIDVKGGGWRIVVKAVLARGDETDLATIAGGTRAMRRHPSPRHRAITAPDFVIIGTQRGGTSSLYAYLCQHPHIVPAATKELHFFTDRYERGLDWYLGQFPMQAPRGHLTGEATPYALFHPLAPIRLRAVAPNAKLIVLLRNPVERAYSQYLLERSRGDETLDFAAAIDAETARLANEEARLLADPGYVSAPHKHASYLARGDYAPQLERWLSIFPREQFLVMRSEDLFQDPAGSFARVTRFLGLPPLRSGSFEVHNQSAGSPLDPELRRRLVKHFEPRNVRLAQLLGWDPGWD